MKNQFNMSYIAGLKKDQKRFPSLDNISKIPCPAPAHFSPAERI